MTARGVTDAMTDRQFDFLQDHSLRFLEMAFRTDRLEPLENPDGAASHTGVCGDAVDMALRLEGERIAQVAFQVRGCIHTVAALNAAAELVEGRSLAAAWEVTPERVIEFLETLPRDHHHCAELAVGALHRTLADARRRRQEPWRKLYGRPR